MATTYLAPDPIQSTQFIPGGAVPANGGQLFFYLAGTSTKQTVYKDNAAAVAWTNPIVLDSGGNLPSGGEVWFSQGISYKVVFAPATDSDPPVSPYWTKDNLSGMNDVSATTSEWIAGSTPTFVSATSFTLVGDQTATFTIGRRVRTTNSGGTVYSTITGSVFGALTTVSVLNDSGAIDSGLSAVAYGILNATNPSIPNPTVGGASVRRSASKNNTTSLFSKWDMSAQHVVTRNPTTGVLTMFNGASSVTVNISTAGPVANGQDQAALFSTDSFVHFYWINTAARVLAGIASSNDALIGPTLPSTYVAWAYDTTVRINSARQLARMYTVGNKQFYGAQPNLVTLGNATTESSITAALQTLVPENAEHYQIGGQGEIDLISTFAQATLSFLIATSQTYVVAANYFVAAGSTASDASQREVVAKSAFTVICPVTGYLGYKWGIAQASTVSMEAQINWYSVPNGG